jgi:hypothetical protein
MPSVFHLLESNKLFQEAGVKIGRLSIDTLDIHAKLIIVMTVTRTARLLNMLVKKEVVVEETKEKLITHAISAGICQTEQDLFDAFCEKSVIDATLPPLLDIHDCTMEDCPLHGRFHHAHMIYDGEVLPPPITCKLKALDIVSALVNSSRIPVREGLLLLQLLLQEPLLDTPDDVQAAQLKYHQEQERKAKQARFLIDLTTAQQNQAAEADKVAQALEQLRSNPTTGLKN